MMDTSISCISCISRKAKLLQAKRQEFVSLANFLARMTASSLNVGIASTLWRAAAFGIYPTRAGSVIGQGLPMVAIICKAPTVRELGFALGRVQQPDFLCA